MEAGVGRCLRVALAGQGTLGDHRVGDRIYTGPDGLEAEGVIDRIGAPSGAQPYLGGWGRQGWGKGYDMRNVKGGVLYPNPLG